MKINYFGWNKNTIDHLARHGVTPEEVEEVAFNNSPYIRKGREGKRYLYGQTIGGRYLFIVYVLTGNGRAQAITARDMDTRERKLYLKRGK